MSAETDLRTLLTGTAALTDLVGTRIRPNRAEEHDAWPYVVYSRAGTENEYALSGELLESKAIFQIIAWAVNPLDAEAIGDVIQEALEADSRMVTARTGEFDPESSLTGAALTVDWWDD